MESERIWARAAIMRAAVNREDAPERRARLAGLADRLRRPGDHRRRHPRAGPPHPRRRRDARRRLPGARCAEAEARELIAAEPSMAGRDLAREVTPAARARPTADGGGAADRRDRHRHQGLDRPPPRRARRGGRRCTRAPSRAEELLATDADAFFLANGPGDPAALDYVVDTVRELVGKRPVWGICLGHQLLCRAVGLETYKLPFGHRGGNHPVKDLHDRAGSRSPRRTTASRSPAPDGGAAHRGRRAGALGDRLRRGRADPRQPLRPHRRGARAARRRRRAPSSTTPRPAPAPTTRLYLFDRFLEAVRAAARRHPEDPDPRLRPDRHRPGRRVRLLRRAGLQGPARGGLRDRPRQLQPGDDHDRPRVRRRDLRRAAAARAGRAGHRDASAPTRCCRRSAARPR